jgi:hypothetical protein
MDDLPFVPVTAVPLAQPPANAAALLLPALPVLPTALPLPGPILALTPLEPHLAADPQPPPQAPANVAPESLTATLAAFAALMSSDRAAQQQATLRTLFRDEWKETQEEPSRRSQRQLMDGRSWNDGNLHAMAALAQCSAGIATPGYSHLCVGSV